MSFGINILPPHIYFSTNDRPPVEPFEMSHSEHDDLARLSSTWALPILAYRREALCSRGYRAPNPPRRYGMLVAAQTCPSPPRQTTRAVLILFTSHKKKAVHTYLGSHPQLRSQPAHTEPRVTARSPSYQN